ncbi:uncharacterized protein [Epargyreus clarus]|uniref:uncharacterized protein n=1 Tax=Epargyreus clarus TaxID=520877 RepID=UPI003C2B2A18
MEVFKFLLVLFLVAASGAEEAERQALASAEADAEAHGEFRLFLPKELLLNLPGFGQGCSQEGDMFQLHHQGVCYICGCFTSAFGGVYPKCAPCSCSTYVPCGPVYPRPVPVPPVAPLPLPIIPDSGVLPLPWSSGYANAIANAAANAAGGGYSNAEANANANAASGLGGLYLGALGSLWDARAQAQAQAQANANALGGYGGLGGWSDAQAQAQAQANANALGGYRGLGGGYSDAQAQAQANANALGGYKGLGGGWSDAQAQAQAQANALGGGYGGLGGWSDAQAQAQAQANALGGGYGGLGGWSDAQAQAQAQANALGGGYGGLGGWSDAQAQAQAQANANALGGYKGLGGGWSDAQAQAQANANALGGGYGGLGGWSDAQAQAQAQANALGGGYGGLGGWSDAQAQAQAQANANALGLGYKGLGGGWSDAQAQAQANANALGGAYGGLGGWSDAQAQAQAQANANALGGGWSDAQAQAQAQANANTYANLLGAFKSGESESRKKRNISGGTFGGFCFLAFLLSFGNGQNLEDLKTGLLQDDEFDANSEAFTINSEEPTDSDERAFGSLSGFTKTFYQNGPYGSYISVQPRPYRPFGYSQAYGLGSSYGEATGFSQAQTLDNSFGFSHAAAEANANAQALSDLTFHGSPYSSVNFGAGSSLAHAQADAQGDTISLGMGTYGPYAVSPGASLSFSSNDNTLGSGLGSNYASSDAIAQAVTSGIGGYENYGQDIISLAQAQATSQGQAFSSGFGAGFTSAEIDSQAIASGLGGLSSEISPFGSGYYASGIASAEANSVLSTTNIGSGLNSAGNADIQAQILAGNLNSFTSEEGSSGENVYKLSSAFAGANSRLIPPEEYIMPNIIPGGETIKICTREGEFHNVWSIGYDCLICACVSQYGYLSPICVTCDVCSAAIPFPPLPIPMPPPSMIPSPTPPPVPSPIPSLIPSPTPPSIPTPEPQVSCDPLPTNTPFQNPLNPCQICICQYSFGFKTDVTITCEENPSCVLSSDLITIPPVSEPPVPELLPLCEKFPPNVEFPHPVDICKSCECVVSYTDLGPQHKIVCYPKPECEPSSPIPSPFPSPIPSPIPSPTPPPTTELLPWPPLQKPLPPGPLPGPPPQPRCRYRPPWETFTSECQSCKCQSVFTYVIARCVPIPGCVPGQSYYGGGATFAEANTIASSQFPSSSFGQSSGFGSSQSDAGASSAYSGSAGYGGYLSGSGFSGSYLADESSANIQSGSNLYTLSPYSSSFSYGGQMQVNEIDGLKGFYTGSYPKPYGQIISVQQPGRLIGQSQNLAEAIAQSGYSTQGFSQAPGLFVGRPFIKSGDAEAEELEEKR